MKKRAAYMRRWRKHTRLRARKRTPWRLSVEYEVNLLLRFWNRSVLSC
jgi:hypothetical protein